MYMQFEVNNLLKQMQQAMCERKSEFMNLNSFFNLNYLPCIFSKILSYFYSLSLILNIYKLVKFVHQFKNFSHTLY